jgi:hypothetical protein
MGLIERKVSLARSAVILRVANIGAGEGSPSSYPLTTVTRTSDLIDDILDFARGRLGSGIS